MRRMLYQPIRNDIPPMSYPNIRIGLLWHSMNSDNLGVGALTVAHIVILREIAAGLGLDPQFGILG